MPEEQGKDKVALALATTILIVAIVVLVIDWQIKNAILTESKRVRDRIEGFERKYYNGQVGANRLGDPSDGITIGGDNLAGDAGMATPDGDAGSVPVARTKARERNRADARARIGVVEVSEADREVRE